LDNVAPNIVKGPSEVLKSKGTSQESHITWHSILFTKVLLLLDLPKRAFKSNNLNLEEQVRLKLAIEGRFIIYSSNLPAGNYVRSNMPIGLTN